MRPLCEKLKRTTLMRERASRICGGEGGLTSGSCRCLKKCPVSDPLSYNQISYGVASYLIVCHFLNRGIFGLRFNV